jgi:hypothetical protein
MDEGPQEGPEYAPSTSAHGGTADDGGGDSLQFHARALRRCDSFEMAERNETGDSGSPGAGRPGCRS